MIPPPDAKASSSRSLRLIPIKAYSKPKQKKSIANSRGEADEVRIYTIARQIYKCWLVYICSSLRISLWWSVHSGGGIDSANGSPSIARISSLCRTSHCVHLNWTLERHSIIFRSQDVTPRITSEYACHTVSYPREIQIPKWLWLISWVRTLYSSQTRLFWVQWLTVC